MSFEFEDGFCCDHEEEFQEMEGDAPTGYACNTCAQRDILMQEEQMMWEDRITENRS